MKRRFKKKSSDGQRSFNFVPGGIRRSGPGKFDTVVDGYVYETALDGCCEEAGDASGPGWHARVSLGDGETLKSIRESAAEQGDQITTKEEELIVNHAGAIVRENDQGFVGVSYYDSEEELDRAWSEVEEECAEFEEECAEFEGEEP